MLVDPASVLFDAGVDRRPQLVDQIRDELRIHGLRQSREAGDVGEEHGCLAPPLDGRGTRCHAVELMELGAQRGDGGIHHLVWERAPQPLLRSDRSHELLTIDHFPRESVGFQVVGKYPAHITRDTVRRLPSGGAAAYLATCTGESHATRP